MEKILQTIFPCCFPNRHSHRLQSAGGGENERTPLLRDRSGSLASSSSSHAAGGAGAGGAGARKGSATSAGAGQKSKHTILPTPTYDASTLRSILRDLGTRVIEVDSGTSLFPNARRSGSSKTDAAVQDDSKEDQSASKEPAAETQQTEASKPVAAVYTLKLNLKSSTNTLSGPTSLSSSPSTKPKLVDIWTESIKPPSSTTSNSSNNSNNSGSTTPSSSSRKMSYSAAAKRGKKSNTSTAAAKNLSSTTTTTKPFPSSSTSTTTKDGRSPTSAAEIEQKTFETLSELILSKPLIHRWEHDDELQQ